MTKETHKETAEVYFLQPMYKETTKYAENEEIIITETGQINFER